MRIIVLSSGSSGNATFIELGGRRLLIDVGLSYKSIDNELHKLRSSVQLLDGVFITHSHNDHVAGLKTLLKNAMLPLYIGWETVQEIQKSYGFDLTNYAELHILESNMPVTWEQGLLSVLPLRVKHDVQSFGFYLDSPEGSIVYVTDTGFLPKCHGEMLKDKDYYIFESNYDPEMLRSCRYNHYVKQRIASPTGHMSNEYSAHCTSQLVGPHTKKVVLAHISENSNTEDLALAAHRCAMREVDFDLRNIVCAHQRRVLKVVDDS
ncbi:MAG: MBL fold metallo-hydrolase [bacterium]|nr:MBL fold metallo-hydrolase [bacterium]